MLTVALLAPLARHARRIALALVLVALASAALVLPARAAEPSAAAGAPALDAPLLDAVRRLALQPAQPAEARDGTPAGTGTGADAGPRIEIEVGRLDPRLRLAPCARIEPYLPPGTRPWGRSRIGLRCTQGTVPWNVYLPVTVKAYGRGVVVTGPVSAGSVLTAADLSEAEVDLAEESTAVLVDRAQAEGRVLARSLQPGQAVRQGHLKLRQFFAAGETVRVIARGDGYALEVEGQALNPGVEGSPARVRTENGRILTGQPVAERRMEMAL